ncbi:MAG: tyrosine-type recombinase/integrase [Actinomycetota bacterium]|nr:tyrosine-type recombinase/integrase [Actinomycetota bacterium]
MAEHVGEAARRFVDERLMRHEIAESTAKWLRDGLRYFVTFVGPDRTVRSITRDEILAWMTETAPTVSVASYRMRATSVRLFFTWATLEGLTAGNPFTGIQMPRKPRSVPRGLRDQQVGAVLAHAKDARERLMISLMVREGLRALEVAGLEIGDVDFQDRTLFVKGKGGHERVIPLTEETAEVIREYVAEERGPRSGRLIQSRLHSVWNEEDGVKPHTVVVQVSRAMKRAGVKESGHALRHSFAYGLIGRGRAS